MRSLRRLLLYIRPYLAGMATAAALLAISGALMGVVAATMKPLVNYVLLQKPIPPAATGGNDVLTRARELLPLDRLTSWAGEHAFVQVPLLFVGLFFVKAVFTYFGEYLTTRAGVHVIRDLRADLYRSVVEQSLRFFQANPSGLILSRILNDIARLQKLCTTVLADTVRVGVMAPFMLGVALWSNWRLTVFSAIALPLLAWPMVRLGRKLRRASRSSQEAMADVANVVAETVSGVKVVQGFSMERFEVERFRTALGRMVRADLRAGRAAALAPAVLELFGAVAGAAVFVLAGWLIAARTLDPGEFMVVMTALAALYMSIRRLNQSNVELQMGIAAAERVFDMMDRASEIRDPAAATDLPPFSREIRFEAVDFAYDDDRVLHGVDLVVRRGEVVALVGASGSGKSTIANLVCRFYDPTRGRITIDDHDVRRVTLASLRGQIGLVTQETVLFNATVRRNIAYGRDDIPLDRVVAAARAAHAEGFVGELPQGWDTTLGERGARLSMGQRQRLTIARALLKDPPILILDEATSALDAESESLVQEALERLMHGRTSIVIAHRLATVRRADRIVVLDRGRIVEEGTHETLIAKGGTYARLHALQFESTTP